MSVPAWKSRLALCRDATEIQGLLDEVERWVIDGYGPPHVPGAEASLLQDYTIGLYQLSELLAEGAELPEALQPESGNRWMVMALRRPSGEVELLEPSGICPHPTAHGAAELFLDGLAAFEALPPVFPERSIRLGGALRDAVALWGEPESVPSELIEGGTDHHFRLARICTGRVTEWEGAVHGILYSWSAAFDDNLLWVARQHAEGHGWDEIEQGYLYARTDGEVRITCSVMPWIGVWTTRLTAAWRPNA